MGLTYADMARLAYKPAPTVTQYGQWQMQPLDHRTRLFVSPGEVVIAFRGTVPSDPSDLLADAALLNGTEHTAPVFRKAVKQVESALIAFPGRKLTLTGHSLGGGVALYAFAKHWKRVSDVYAYNPGMGKSAIFQGLKDLLWCKIARTSKCKKYKRAIHIFRTKWDPISILGAPSATTVRQTAKDPHTIDNFTSPALSGGKLAYGNSRIVVKNGHLGMMPDSKNIFY